jgi:aryl-alcohol dehydrogenase-like predicted oxidoreductase
MEKRRLGRTDHTSTVVIFGAAAFWSISQEAANETLDLALAHGVNHIDVAPLYGQAEERIGPWLESRRGQFFLGCKTIERGRDSAWIQLHQSLEKLHTDKFDLYQLHAVTSFEELDKALAKGGAIETLTRARDEGLTQYLGITGHGIHTPAVFAAALERFDFDSVMFPIHPRLYADPQYRRDSEALLQMAADHDVGVMVIKAVTRAAWGTQTKNYNTWYQPYDTAAEIENGVRFALSQPGVTGIPSAGDTRLLPMILDAAERFTPISQDEQEALIEQSRELDPMFYEGQTF